MLALKLICSFLMSEREGCSSQMAVGALAHFLLQPLPCIPLFPHNPEHQPQRVDQIAR